MVRLWDYGNASWIGRLAGRVFEGLLQVYSFRNFCPVVTTGAD